ncbi:MAG TPA: hypothetical protein VM712_01460, partial [Gaiellales bacterium]|nr:hypothetical protein [Gaiellales bacterium]
VWREFQLGQVRVGPVRLEVDNRAVVRSVRSPGPSRATGRAMGRRFDLSQPSVSDDALLFEAATRWGHRRMSGLRPFEWIACGVKCRGVQGVFSLMQSPGAVAA